MSLHPRLLARSVRNPTTGCLLWLGARTSAGYGNINVGSRTDGSRRKVQVHRLAYETAIGPIPDGLHVLHHCDIRLCIEPTHLFAGTDHDNTLDMMAKGRAWWQIDPSTVARGERHGSHTKPESRRRGEMNGSSVLTAVAVREIRTALAAGSTHRELADRFGVSREAITAIALRKTWRHLDK